MTAAATAAVPRVVLTRGFAEPTVELRDPDVLERLYAGVFGLFRGPVEHDGGDRSPHVEDREGNVVQVWDFFERGAGRRKGAAALSGGDVQPVDPSS